MIRRTALPALAAAAALALAACGGGAASSPHAGGTDSESSPTSPSSPSSSGPAASDSSSSVPTATTSPATVVDGVKLTPQGSELQLGDTARVSWKPDQKTVGVVGITVTRLRRVPISAFSDWRLDAATQRSTPYYVSATVRNLGRSDLSGRAVPLYLLDERNTLLQASTFQAQYSPCPSRPLPGGFSRGRRTSVCLVYFAPKHGKLVAVSFRPTESFQAITWKGPVSS